MPQTDPNSSGPCLTGHILNGTDLLQTATLIYMESDAQPETTHLTKKKKTKTTLLRFSNITIQQILCLQIYLWLLLTCILWSLLIDRA